MSENVVIDLRGVENKQKAVNDLAALLQSDGWKLYVGWLKGQHQLNIEAMCRPDASSEQLHKLSGQTRLLNIVTNWPTLTLETLRRQLETQQKKEK